jgi:arabinogalactan endo-1,4-beta-galactosidase
LTTGHGKDSNFQYSDDWADGEKQIIPAAWAGIKDTDALAQALYDFTADGLSPELIQVGNETIARS